jgi:high affinity Mn2+ porin
MTKSIRFRFPPVSEMRQISWLARLPLVLLSCLMVEQLGESELHAGPPAELAAPQVARADASPGTLSENLSNAWPFAGCPTGIMAQATEESPATNFAPWSPRTLPQALRKYFQCLHCGPAEADEKPATQAERKSGQNHNSDANGAAKNGNGNNSDADKNGAKDEWYSAHAQATVITQKHSRFVSPYSAFNSLPSVEPYVTSETTTAFLAARLWEGGEVVFNPEVAGGRGFGAVVSGIANYPNEEITRVGVAEPTPYIARLLFRQTFGFGGEQEKVENDVNQIAGERDDSRLTVSIGKMAATDVVDDNRYSHDPRNSFLPWAMTYNGAWDYPANVRGYTYGVAFDLNQKDWALRYGIFAVARFANSPQLDPHILKANGQVLEWERRYCVDDRPGKLRVWGYLNRAHMGNYDLAVREMPVDPDVTATRAYRIRYGFGGNVEQELSKDLAGFAKFGWNDGHNETWMFTEIDSTLVMGLLLKGRCWCRPQDQVGLVFALDGISPDHRAYLGHGGLGFIIGDGRLNYGHEKTVETFYNFEVRKGIAFALDLQGIDNPAYNRDRGPVLVVSGRLHIEF